MNEQTVRQPGRVVAIVGRPNVGKSALFNRIARRRIAIVFDQPGVTRDRVAREVEANGQRFMLVDTGGLAFDRTFCWLNDAEGHTDEIPFSIVYALPEGAMAGR